MRKTVIIVSIIIVLLALAILFWYFTKTDEEPEKENVNSFEECVAKGNAILESYPRQCQTPGGKTFTEYIGNELEKMDLIVVSNPRPNQEVQSPLVVSGKARGYWFFEASFPIVLTDWDGNVIAQGIAQAKDEWMTEEFVDFEATLDFEKPGVNKGILILKKDNPSGLPENDDALEIPVVFGIMSYGKKNMTATIRTSKGDIKIELFSSLTPKTADNFAVLAKSGFYNKTKFHRVIDSFMIQGGDPLSKDDSKRNYWGTGGPGYSFEDEIGPQNNNNAGTIAMANSGPNTNGSQFFINTVDNNYLDSKHTVFGKVIEGMDVIHLIESSAVDSSDRPVEDVVIEVIEIEE